MQKEIVLAKLKEFAGRPIVVGLADEGVVLYGGIEGHWLFNSGDSLIEIKKNIGDGVSHHGDIDQHIYPFQITTVNFDTINYVRSFIGRESGEIKKFTSGFTPVATKDDLSTIINIIEGDSIHKASAPRGNLNSETVKPNGPFGQWRGVAISTNIEGLPKYYDDMVEKEDIKNK